jgi:hypothetical protein
MHNLLGVAGREGSFSVGISVQGELNVLEGNILNFSRGNPGGGTGIEFLADGNFYGNNRMNATVPFNLGGTTQTDWGGNVSF